VNEKLRAALEYAAHGWHVLPCVAGEKRPLTTHGVHDATTDTLTIKRWWQRHPDANVAVACGEKSGITVVDMDDNCEEWLEKLPKTLTQKTRNGGYSAFYSYFSGINNAVRLRPGLDIRNDAGYTLLPPSYVKSDRDHDGIYRWITGWDATRGKLPEFPKELIIPKQEYEPKQEIAHPTAEIPPDQLARASLYLAECDPAIQGNGGHNKLLYAADRMVNGFLLTNDQAYDILSKEFNPRCIPPWDLTNEKDERDFRRKITEARKLKGQHEPGWLIAGSCADTRQLSGIIQPLLSSNKPTVLQTANLGRVSPTDTQCYESLINPPGLLGEICRWMNETALIPQPLLSLGASLTFLGALLGRKVCDGLGSRTNLYCMGVAPSSAGKNHAITCVRNLAAEALCTQLLGGEYVASDAAIEERMSRNPATLFLWDEVGYLLSHVNSGMSKNHAQVVSLLMKLYSSASSIYLGREYAEKDKQRTIIQPCCSIYGTATPESFASGLSPEQLQDGWLSRCLVFYSKDRPTKQRNLSATAICPPEIVEQVKRWYEWQPEWPNESAVNQWVLPDRDGRYQERPPYQITIPETDEATKIFIDFDNETIKIGDSQPEVACLWKKGEENARRIALIVACANCFEQPIIDSQIADYSCRLVQYLLESFVANVAPEIVATETERRKRRLLKAVTDAGSNGMTRGQLTKKSHWVDSGQRQRLIDDLLASGELLFSKDKEES